MYQTVSKGIGASTPLVYKAVVRRQAVVKTLRVIASPKTCQGHTNHQITIAAQLKPDRRNTG
jgi:hypothetical protein